MYCINCGNRVNSTDKFCDKCGTKIGNSTNTQESPTKETNISLILGIISCCLFFIPLVSIPLAIIAIILGIINRKKHKIVGAILGIISIIITVIEILLIVLLFKFIINEGIIPYLENTYEEIIEEEVEISGNTFIAPDNSVIEFLIDGSYNWYFDEYNYNKGNYIVKTGLSAYNYAKTNLTGFNSYEYDIDDFYLIITTPTEIVVNGAIINEFNTVHYYGEYDYDEQTLELYNHNSGNKLDLTLYDEYQIGNIDI